MKIRGMRAYLGASLVLAGFWLGLVYGFGQQPAETEPAETEPAETEPVETDPAETDPRETESMEAEEPSGSPAKGPETSSEATPEVETKAPGGEKVYVVPIEGQISQPQLFILRRALKQAVEEDVDTIILDMDTPGGSAGTMMQMMEALDRFPGTTVTYVNPEAISAGAYIASASDYIYMTPKALIGAAEVVMGTGEDVPESMKRKLNSYLQAKVRSLNSEHPGRGDVIRAMSDPTFVLEIDGEVISPEGELLTLTGEEAVKQYGDPPRNLLADALVEEKDDLLSAHFGDSSVEWVDFEISWSEEVAKYLSVIAPALLGIGMLMLFIEFKTPGFGFFGVAGILLVLTVFATNYVAGLAGYEEVLLFALGVALILVEIFLLPGTFFFAGLGLLLMVGSLVWAMADIWPEGSDFTLTPEVFMMPMLNTLSGFAVGIFGVILLSRVLPKSWYWSHIALQSQVGRSASSVAVGRESNPAPVMEGGGPGPTPPGMPDIGETGVAVTDLFPSGEIEIDGKRYQARTSLNQIESGTPIVVIDHRDFALIVRPKD